MRVTLVTETYFPQVNGVSRTLGQLVRHLTECGDSIQLIHPDYGPGVEHDERAHLVRSIVLPFYKELHLPLPPFRPVHRAIASFGPGLIHIATEATLGLSVLRFALRNRLNTVSSFHTNFDQYSGHYGFSWARGMIWRYLRWFHNDTRETYVPSQATIRELERLGFERMMLWKRGVDSSLFRPDRAGRFHVRRALGWGPEDVVITYVSRIAPEKNVDPADALAIVPPGSGSACSGRRRADTNNGTRIGSFAHFAGYRQGTCGPLPRRHSLSRADGSIRQRGARSDGVRSSGRRRPGRRVGGTIGSESPEFSSNRGSSSRMAATPELIENRGEGSQWPARAHALRRAGTPSAGLRNRYEVVIDEHAGRLGVRACRRPRARLTQSRIAQILFLDPQLSIRREGDMLFKNALSAEAARTREDEWGFWRRAAMISSVRARQGYRDQPDRAAGYRRRNAGSDCRASRKMEGFAIQT
jgi:hypothetical protein